DDGSFVRSVDDPQGDAFQVKLTRLACPKTPGDQILTVRLRQTGTDGSATFALLQGDQVIGGQAFEPTTSFAPFSMTLTAEQIARISDYADLRVVVVANDPVVSGCDNPLPALLHATLSGSDGCACAEGVQVLLLW